MKVFFDENNYYTKSNFDFVSIIGNILLYCFMILFSPFWVPLWCISKIEYVIDFYYRFKFYLSRWWNDKVDSALEQEHNVEIKETQKQAIILKDNLESLLKEKTKDLLDQPTTDFRVKKVIEAICSTADFAYCLNGLSGAAQSVDRVGLNAAVVRDYIKNIIGPCLSKTWNWSRRYECVSVVLLSDYIIRNDWQQDKRNHIAIDFLANEFYEFAKERNLNQKELWQFRGWEECMNHIISLLEFRMITKVEACGFMKEMYSEAYLGVGVNPMFKLLFTNTILGGSFCKKLDVIIEGVMLKNPEISYKALKANSWMRSPFISLFNEAKKQVGNLSLIELKASIHRVMAKKGEAIVELVKPNQYVYWTSEAIRTNFVKQFGEGPFKVMSRNFANDVVTTYTIKTVCGQQTFGACYLSPII